MPRTLRSGPAWTAAAVATLAMSVSYIDRQTLAVLAPTVREGLGISREQYGALLAAFSLAYLVGAPFAGAVIDRVGARRGLVAAVLAWSLVAAGHALVPSFAVMFAMRIALGLAEAPSFPGATQTIRRVLPPEKRSAGFGLLFTGSSIGSTIAAPVAIAIHHRTGSWRFAFLGTAFVGLAWLPVWIAITSRKDVREVLAAPAGDAASAPPGSRVALLKSPEVLRALLLVVASAPSIMFCLNWYAQYLADAFAMKQDAMAKYLWIPPLFFDLGAVVFGAMASRADAKARGEMRTHAPLVIAAGCFSAAMVPMTFVHEPWLATALAAASLVGGGACFALLTADVLARVDARHVSTASGLCAAAQSLAYIVAGPLVGAVVDRTHSYAVVLTVLGGIVPPATILWAFWPISTRHYASAA